MPYIVITIGILIFFLSTTRVNKSIKSLTKELKIRLGLALPNNYWINLKDVSHINDGARNWRITMHNLKRVSSIEFFSGLTGGLIVAILTISMQAYLDDQRSLLDDRRENLRFVRDKSTELNVTQNTTGAFLGMDLQDQILAGLSLNNPNFNYANLKKTSWMQAILKNPSFVLADLRASRFVGTRIVGKANFSYSDLRGADLTGLDVEGEIDFTGANLSYTTFYDLVENYGDFYKGPELMAPAFAVQVNLRGANFTDADLIDANLAFVDLTDSIIYRADLRGADLLGVDLTGSSIEKTDLRGADLSGANNINESKIFSSNCYNNKTKWPKDYRPELPSGKIEKSLPWLGCI